MRKKILGMLLISTMLMGGFTAYAAGTETVSSNTGNGNANITVNATVTAAWEIELPATLTMYRIPKEICKYSTDYTIKCKGLVEDTYCVYAYPDNANNKIQFTKTGSTVKATGNITQKKKYFVMNGVAAQYTPNDSNAYAYLSTDGTYTSKGIATGTIEASFTELGDYTGTLSITYGSKLLSQTN